MKVVTLLGRPKSILQVQRVNFSQSFSLSSANPIGMVVVKLGGKNLTEWASNWRWDKNSNKKSRDWLFLGIKASGKFWIKLCHSLLYCDLLTEPQSLDTQDTVSYKLWLENHSLLNQITLWQYGSVWYKFSRLLSYLTSWKHSVNLYSPPLFFLHIIFLWFPCLWQNQKTVMLVCKTAHINSSLELWT